MLKENKVMSPRQRSPQVEQAQFKVCLRCKECLPCSFMSLILSQKDPARISVPWSVFYRMLVLQGFYVQILLGHSKDILNFFET